MRDYSKLPGVLFEMFNWDGSHPERGALGFERWEKLNPGAGEYNWQVIDTWLDKQNGKPCAFSIATHLSQMDGWESFYDATPEWVYDSSRPTMNGRRVGKTVTASVNGVVKTAAMPYYNDQAVWWKALEAFTRAFGARYDNDPRLTAVFFGPGLDMENQPSKAPFSDANQGYRFGQLCDAYIRWYAEAFPTKPTFFVCTTGQGRMAQAQLAASYGLGVKNNGLLPDMDSWQGYDNWVGAWDPMAWANENGAPVAVETAHWLSKENMYWGIYASLHYHPAIVDVHSGWFDSMPPEWATFWANHVNRTATTAPDAWCVLRDSEYPTVSWTGTNDKRYGCSGHIGNWDYYLHMLDGADAPRFEDVGPSDAPESRQCRRVTSATFTVELAAEPPYKLEVRWLQEPGKTLWVDDSASSQMVESAGSDAWATTELTVKSRTFTLRGGVHVHMITATPDSGNVEPDVDTDLDTDVLWAGINGAQAAIDDARREVYQADVSIGTASQAIAEAARALQTAVAQHEEASALAVKAMETLDVATSSLADMRAEMERTAE